MKRPSHHNRRLGFSRQLCRYALETRDVTTCHTPLHRLFDCPFQLTETVGFYDFPSSVSKKRLVSVQ